MHMGTKHAAGNVFEDFDGRSGAWEDVSGTIATADDPRGLVTTKGISISPFTTGTAPAGRKSGFVYPL